ncbi:hypothetical protein Btru_040056 [Bulinus truncatus]|nr:hypothetical protein Btru_040056 [Bulinus truncatus]
MKMEYELERDIRRLQQDHLRRMYELQREIERLRQESIYLKIQDKPSKIIVHQPPPIQVSAPAPAPVVQPQIFEVDRLAPYDYRIRVRDRDRYQFARKSPENY